MNRLFSLPAVLENAPHPPPRVPSFFRKGLFSGFGRQVFRSECGQWSPGGVNDPHRGRMYIFLWFNLWKWSELSECVFEYVVFFVEWWFCIFLLCRCICVLRFFFRKSLYSVAKVVGDMNVFELIIYIIYFDKIRWVAY